MLSRAPGPHRHVATLLVARAPISCGLLVTFDDHETARATNRLALKGTVDGLEAARVTLIVNGGDPLPEKDNGDFDFADAILDGADYVVQARAPGPRTFGTPPFDTTKFGCGAAYVFARSGSTWSKETYLQPRFPDDTAKPAAVDFGRAVALSASGETLAVGAPDDPSAVSGVDAVPTAFDVARSGAVYTYARSGGAWPNGAFIKASTPQVDASLGSAVALSADGATLLVGSVGETSASNSPNGTGGAVIDAGAAYVFVRSASSWSQRSFLKASNTEASALFGQAVSISGDARTILVGAPGEASNATGVNGDSTNVFAPGAGAGYVY